MLNLLIIMKPIVSTFDMNMNMNIFLNWDVRLHFNTLFVVRELMQSVKAKIHSITEVYRYHTKDKPDNVEELSNMYQDHYAEMKVDNSWSIAGSKAILPKPTPHDVHSKELINRGQMMIPTNHSIKARSHRIVDEHKKVEEVRS